MTRLVLTTLAVLAVASAACGGVENEPNLAAAIEKTESAGSFAIEMAIPGAEGGEKSCVGAVDVGRGSFGGTCDVGSGGYEFVVVDDTAYFTRPGVADEWTKLALDGENVVEQLAPDSFLGVLRSASRTTERVGEHDVRGKPTVRYALAVDCERAEILNCEGTAAVDVWIDDQGLVRRIRHNDDSDVVILEFYDFGLPVEIDPPPADQVVEGGLQPGEGGIETGPIETIEVETTPAP